MGVRVTTATDTAAARDAEFVDRLRSATQKYLDAIDAWESSYQKFYRMPAPGPVSSDLESEHRAYLAARKELQQHVPNARRLCLKHSLRDPWPALLHVNLGGTTPQTGFSPAIGRSERGTVAQSLEDLESACREPRGNEPAFSRDSQTERSRGLLRRILDFFV
jgi:hypothetical protein